MDRKTSKRKARETVEMRLSKDWSEEEAHDRFEDWTQVRRLTKYLRPRIGQIVVAIILSVILSQLLLAPSVLTKYIVDTYVKAADFSGVVLMCAILLAIMLVTTVVEGFATYKIQRIGQDSIRDLRMDLFRHLEYQSLSFYDKRPVGWLVTRMTSDVNVLHELFSQGVVGIFQQVLSLAGIVAILLYFNWQLALWGMIVVPPVLFFSSKFRRSVRVSYRMTRLRLSRLNAHVQENVTGMKTVQANTREPRQFDQFEALNDLYRDAHFRTVFAMALYFPLVELCSAAGMGILVWQGGHQYLEGRVTVGELIMFFGLMQRFFMPIRDLAEKFNLLQSAIAASERLFKLLDEEPKVEDPPQPIPSGTFQHRIEFKDVWFAYKEEDWVLKGVSFTIERGQTVALVGPTGSGKTTLMSLLCRFYDIQKGQILIDGTDIREMTQADLRRKIAIVLQDVFLFRGTIADNIRLGNEEIDDERVRQVAQAVNADWFIERLPDAYEAEVMERGATLSVGQKQLLAFARALAFDPQILILDEATSNIDTETEKLIQTALGRLLAGRTALVIAHRLSTIQAADNILVLHHGLLAEQGNHRELLGRDGLYRKLYELQYREELVS